MITYKPQNHSSTAAFLDGRRVGTINPVNKGYQYLPIGSKKGGHVFPTVSAVKRSIESSE